MLTPSNSTQVTVGRLGATAPLFASDGMILHAGLGLAERHILRLEAALRKLGVDVDELELPE